MMSIVTNLNFKKCAKHKSNLLDAFSDTELEAEIKVLDVENIISVTPADESTAWRWSALPNADELTELLANTPDVSTFEGIAIHPSPSSFSPRSSPPKRKGKHIPCSE